MNSDSKIVNLEKMFVLSPYAEPQPSNPSSYRRCDHRELLLEDHGHGSSRGRARHFRAQAVLLRPDGETSVLHRHADLARLDRNTYTVRETPNPLL